MEGVKAPGLAKGGRKGRREEIRTLFAALMLAVTIVVVAVILIIRAGEPDEPINQLLRDGGSSRVVTVEEAQLLLPFEFRLPSFLPTGVSSAPELSVMEDDGTPYLLVAEYPEASTPSAEGPPLRMVINQADSVSFIPLSLEPQIINVLGERTWFLPLPPDGGPLRALTAWNHAGVGYFVELAWLADEAPDEEGITSQMRAEVIKTVESMVAD